MNIESLEINVLKVSEIEDKDIIIVKIEESDKLKFSKETIQSLYQQIKTMIKKEDIPIYFFPKNLSIDIIKNHVIQVEVDQKKIEELINENTNENTNEN